MSYHGEEDKDHEAFEEYWKRRRKTAVGYFGEHDALEMSRIIALDSFNQGIDHERDKKEQKRSPVFQPKPGDIVGCGEEYRKVNSYYEYEENIFVSYGQNKNSNNNEYYGDLQIDLSEWQSWAKKHDFIRKRRKVKLDKNLDK